MGRNDSDSAGGEKVLTWSVHLLKMKPLRAAKAGIVGLVFLGILYWGDGDPIMLAVAGLALIVAINSFLFPLRYRLDDTGVTLRTVLGKQEFKWRRFKEYYFHDDCLELSFGRRDLRSKILRAVYLYYPPEEDMKGAIIRRAFDGIGVDLDEARSEFATNESRETGN